MSMYPSYFEGGRPGPSLRHLLVQHFGLGLTPQHNVSHAIAVPRTMSTRPCRNLQTAAQDVGSKIREDKDKFQVHLDVLHFSLKEISVKTADGFLIVEAKHEEMQDEHGFISRSFSRRYLLPDGINADLVTSKLSSDGVLSIMAPLKAPSETGYERVIPIVQTSPVKKQVEDSGEENSKN